MRLFIAEKPSMGKAIAQYLPQQGRPTGAAGGPPSHIVAGDDVVTWCFGHMYESAEPEDYSEAFKQWSFETLPIVPDQWRLMPKPTAKPQIAAIKKLLSQATHVVHAGDPDREGQLLVDELLEELGNRLPVSRIWLSALDESSVRKALADLRPNADYRALKVCAESRQRSDWLVGMNLTRSFTLAGRKSGYDGVLSIGRVQTPTLALVVNRDLAIEHFKPTDFYGVQAVVEANGQAFSARWKLDPDTPVDADGRLLDQSVAAAQASKVSGQTGAVSSFEAAVKKQAAPLPYSLSSLQLAADKKHGLGAQEVLDAVQALYEAKLTSYPRTDCPYLPESQFGDAAGILAGLPDEYAQLVAQADPSIRSKAWDDKLVTAHHAIIPTGQKGALQGNQALVFDMIVRAYVAQFYEAHTFRQTSIQIRALDATYLASGKIPLSPGWKVVFGAEADAGDDDAKDKNEAQELPVLAEGQSVLFRSAAVVASKTTKPQHFSEGTLTDAMNHIDRFVTDPVQKKMLRENASIGTVATQGAIIETLKKREFLVELGSGKKKKIVSTPTARKLIAGLPDALKSPGITGLFEQLLKGIEEGTVTQAQFMEKQTAYVRKYVEQAKTIDLGIAAPHPCPVCKEGSLRRRKNDNGAFWGCSRYQEGCKTSFADKAGKPDFAPKKPTAAKRMLSKPGMMRPRG